MNVPKVSVIIPINSEKLNLKACLDSILGQTLKELELLCVDTGSAGGSADIIKQYAAQDARVSFCGGYGRIDAGTAKNIGLSIARGKYLAVLDGGDCFDQSLLEEACDRAEADRADVVVFSVRQLDFGTDAMTEIPCGSTGHIFTSFRAGMRNKLFRADFIKENSIQFQAIAKANDVAFACEVLALAERISILPSAHMTFNVETDTDDPLFPICFWASCKEARSRLVKAGVYENVKQSFLNGVLSGMMQHLRSATTDFAYRELLYLLKYERNEFHLDDFEEAYFYSKEDYREYKDICAAAQPFGEPCPNPKVSVILPCLNPREYIRECIESIMEQTLRDIEILVVDAGSTDGTPEILERYAELDRRIRIIHSDRKSYGYQMNLGLKHAKGTYLGIVESDDYIRPTMYEDLTNIADAHNLEVLKADFRIFKGQRASRTYTYEPIIGPDLYNVVMDPAIDSRALGNFVVSWCGIYRTDFLREHKIYHHESPGASFQDNGFWFQVFTQTHRVMFCNKAYYMLRRDNPGSSVFSREKIFCMNEEYNFIRNFLAQHPHLERQYAPLCANMRFRNYMHMLTDLVTDENREEYVMRFSQDFKVIRERGELDPVLFSASSYQTLTEIIDSPEEFLDRYETDAHLDPHFIGPLTAYEYIVKLEKANERNGAVIAEKDKMLREKDREIHNKNRVIQSKNKALASLKNSSSLKIGKTVTWLPRKCKGFIQCCLEHGLFYTVKYAVTKVIRVVKK